MALSRLATVSTAVLSEDDRVEIRHTLDIVTRLVEELDHLRERTNIIDDLIRQRQADQMARATYRLSLVATLFLPLGFLTGLLGINVGGIPGSDVDWAFWAVCALLTGLGLFGWWLLRRFRH
jgi:zinc transporter